MSKLLIQAAEAKLQSHISDRDRTMTRLQNAHTHWQQYKRVVRQAHWRRDFREWEQAMLKDFPWQHIAHLRMLEHQLHLEQTKINFFQTIVRFRARPCAEYRQLKRDIMQASQFTLASCNDRTAPRV